MKIFLGTIDAKNKASTSLQHRLQVETSVRYPRQFRSYALYIFVYNIEQRHRKL